MTLSTLVGQFILQALCLVSVWERRLSLAQIFQIGHFLEFCHQPLCPCASGLSPVSGKYRGFRPLRHPLSPRFRRAVAGRRGPFPYAACPAASHRSVSLFLLPPSLNAPQRESCVVTASSPWRPGPASFRPALTHVDFDPGSQRASGLLEVYVTFWAPGPLLLSG